MPTDQPTLPISVVIPAFNAASTIGRAVQSVLAQPSAFRPAEIIVVDDHSDDDTGAIAERLGATVIRHDRNRGAATGRNTGTTAATQPWLALLDADDEWLPNRLSALWPLRAGHVLVSGATVSFYDDEPERRVEYAGTPTAGPLLLTSPAQLIPQNFVMASATLVRRDAVLAAGGYDTTLRYAEDWDLWLRVLEHGTGLMIPEVVALWHRHGNQKSQHASGPRETHRRIVDGCEGRPWWSAALAARWDGLQRWSALEAALQARDWRATAAQAAAMGARPERMRAVITRNRRYRSWIAYTDRIEDDARDGAISMVGQVLRSRRGVAPSERELEPSRSPRVWLAQDWAANRGLYWVQLFLVWFRLAQWADRWLGPLSRLIVTPYWLITSLVLSVEFPASARIGPRLAIFHLHGIVLHPRTRIGSDCVLRHGVTIGNRVDRYGTELGVASLGDHVDVGAGASILGDLHVGDHVRVGAMTLVLQSVPDGGVIVGNPGRVVKVEQRS